MKNYNIRSKTYIILIAIFLITIVVLCGIVNANDTYTYSIEELETILGSYTMYPNDLYHIPEQPLKTQIHSNDFLVFSSNKTLRKEVHETVGTPHANYGSGFVADVYFTSDRYLVLVYYEYGKISQSIRVDPQTKAQEWDFIK